MPTTSPAASTPRSRPVASSPNYKPRDTPSPSNPPPDHLNTRRHKITRLRRVASPAVVTSIHVPACSHPMVGRTQSCWPFDVGVVGRRKRIINALGNRYSNPRASHFSGFARSAFGHPAGVKASDIVALPLQWGSAIRRRRVFHPVGVIANGSLERLASPGEGLPIESSDVVGRVSKGIGLPGGLPDIIGLAIKIPPQPFAATPWDILMASAGSGCGVLSRFARRPVTSWRAPMSSLMPLRYDDRVLVGAGADDGRSRRARALARRYFRADRRRRDRIRTRPGRGHRRLPARRGCDSMR